MSGLLRLLPIRRRIPFFMIVHFAPPLNNIGPFVGR